MKTVKLTFFIWTPKWAQVFIILQLHFTDSLLYLKVYQLSTRTEFTSRYTAKFVV